jgi:hypothetical protein
MSEEICLVLHRKSAVNFASADPPVLDQWKATELLAMDHCDGTH